MFSDSHVKFCVSLWKELFEECVAYAFGVETGVAVIVSTGFVSCKEKHQFGQLVLTNFLSERLAEYPNAIGNSAFSAA